MEQQNRRSWRFRLPYLLGHSLIQERDLCWAIALIRQHEAVLKIEGILTAEQSLSIQELISLMSKRELGPDGGLYETAKAVKILTKFGSVLEEFRPLTYAINHTLFELDPSIPRFPLRFGRVYSRDHYTPAYYERTIIDALNYSPVMASIRSYESYWAFDGTGIYSPTLAELAVPVDDDTIYHSMLLTGSDLHSWEFQETGGDSWGDNGFIFAARGLGLIEEYVVMRV